MCTGVRKSEFRVYVRYVRMYTRIYARVYMCMRIGVVRNATGVAAMRFRNSTRVYRVYRVYRAVMVAVW